MKVSTLNIYGFSSETYSAGNRLEYLENYKGLELMQMLIILVQSVSYEH